MKLYIAAIFILSLHNLASFVLNFVVLAIIGIGLLWLLLKLVRSLQGSEHSATNQPSPLDSLREQDKVRADASHGQLHHPSHN
jgi:hypothetical protein